MLYFDLKIRRVFYISFEPSLGIGLCLFQYLSISRFITGSNKGHRAQSSLVSQRYN